MNNLNKVLIILSSANKLELRNGKEIATGYAMSDLVILHRALRSAGFEVDFASPDGNVPTVDPTFLDLQLFDNYTENLEYAKDYVSKLNELKYPKTFGTILDEGMNSYAGLFIPGGRASMQDLCTSLPLGEILNAFMKKEKPVATLGHGAMALFSAHYYGPKAVLDRLIAGHTMGDSYWKYKGHKMAVFPTADEEIAEDSQLGGRVKVQVEAALKASGGYLQKKETQSEVVEDKTLITGHDSFAAKALADKFIAALRKRQQLEERRLVLKCEMLNTAVASLIKLNVLQNWNKLVEQAKNGTTDSVDIVDHLEFTCDTWWRCGADEVLLPTKMQISIQYGARISRGGPNSGTGIDNFLGELESGRGSRGLVGTAGTIDPGSPLIIEDPHNRHQD